MMFLRHRFGTGPGQLPPRRVVFAAAGALLMFIGIALLALTESGLKNYRLAMARHGGEIQNLDSVGALPEPLQGRMVRVHGALQVLAFPRDPEFGQSAAGTALIRQVAMFQWRQVSIGNQVHYELDWADHPLDARGFLHPAGHANPAQFPIEGRQFDARDVHLEGLVLAPALVHSIPGRESITPDLDSLPPNLAASFSLHGHYLVTSARPGSPVLGDVRVGWESVPLQRVTVVAMLKGKRLLPAVDPRDGKGFQLELGNRSLADLFPDLPPAPRAVWARRLLAMALVWVGALLLFAYRRRGRFEPLLPMGIALLLSGAVAAAMWLGTGTGMSLRWTGCALLGGALIAAPLWWRQRSGGTPAG